MPARVSIHHRIIATVSIHIITEQTLTCGNKTVGRDKPTKHGVVVSGIKVIEIRFAIVVITAVTEGVLCCTCTSSAVRVADSCIAPGVVGIGSGRTVYCGGKFRDPCSRIVIAVSVVCDIRIAVTTF